MSAAEVLRQATDTGISITVVGSDLTLAAAQRPPDHVIDVIRSNKAGIIALLNKQGDGWYAADWRTFYDERAGLAEFDGRQSRANAEALALECCIVEWLNRNPEPSEPDCCAQCGHPEEPDAVVVPFGTDDYGHTWLHPGCWDVWHQQRRRYASTRLSAMGISGPSCRTDPTPDLPIRFLPKAGEAP